MNLNRFLRIVLFFLILINISAPANSQVPWNILKENEKVVFLIEAQEGVKSDIIAREISLVLRLNYQFSLTEQFPGAPPIDALNEIYEFKPKYDLQSFYVLEFQPTEEMRNRFNSPFDIARHLISIEEINKIIKSIEPDLPIFAYPNATLQSSGFCPKPENSPLDIAWALRNMKIPEAWTLFYNSTRSRNIYELQVRVGHPDTGYSKHVDLDESALIIDNKNNFIDNINQASPPEDPLKPNLSFLAQIGHGTATGSVIISRGGISTQPPTEGVGGTTGPGNVTGVAQEALLVPYRAINTVARFTYGNVIKAIFKAVQDRCSVISLSLGGLPSTPLKAALEYAIGNNKIVVAAAGNFSWMPVVYPASYNSCIAVAASCYNDSAWKNSGHGDEVTISAPGEAVWRAYRSKQNEDINIVLPSCGTSYSTAHVAGIAALWLDYHGRDNLIGLLNKETKIQFVFKRLIKKTARCPTEWNVDEYGPGIINAEKLLSADPEEVLSNAKKDLKKFIDEKRQTLDLILKQNEMLINKLYQNNFDK